jgi:hypothetical protein
LQTQDRYVWVAIGVLGLGTLWLILLATGQIAKGVDAIRGGVPSWFPVVNLMVLPIFAALVFIRRPWRLELRVFFLLLFMLSFSTIGLSADRYRLATILVILMVYLEIFWVAPKWNARTGGKQKKL